MLSDIEPRQIGCLIPGRLAGHRIEDELIIDTQVSKNDIAHRSAVVVPGNDRKPGMAPMVSNVFEKNILDPLPRSRIVFFIVHDTEIHKLPLPKILHPDVFKANLPDQVAVAGIETHAPLVVDLVLLLIEDIDIGKM